MRLILTKSILLFLLLIGIKSNAQICPTSTSVSLITNGDFESGNVGFSSSYTYYGSTSAGMGIGNYTIGTNPNIYNTTYYANMTDHNVSGTGKMLLVDVDGTLGKVVYQTTATGIVPNTTYFFSAWFANMERIDNGNGNLTTCVLNTTTCPNGIKIVNTPLMQFLVNGAALNTSLVRVDSLSNNWNQYYFVWNSGTVSGSSIISIANLRNTGGSNDLAMDEVFFGTSCSLISNLNQIGRTSAIPPIVSLCSGGGTYNLDPQLSTSNGTIWKNSGGTTLNTGAKTYTVSSTGTYYLCYDTIPGCYRTDTVSVVNTLSVNIGNDQNLCNPISTNLFTGVSVPPCTVSWFRNGSTTGSNTSSLFVNALGSYYAVVRAPGCTTATSNGVNITSSAPTPSNATYCGTSTVNLAVSPSNSGKYKWWTSATATSAGALLQRGGNSYNLPVSGTATFVVYAEDTSVAKVTTGPASCASPAYSGWSQNLQNEAFLFNVTTPFILDSITVPISGPSSGTFAFRVNIISPASVTTTINVTLNGNGNAFYKISLGGLSLSAGTGYEMNFSGSNRNIGICTIPSAASYPMVSSPYFSITYNKTPPGWNSFNLVGIKDWVLRTGTICSRVPVVASSICALGIGNINLSAYRKENKDIINWQFMGLDIKSFSIQRSANGISFEDVVENLDVEKSGNNISISNIGFINAYYRIKTIDNFNKESYSKIVFVSQGNTYFDATLFPNPSSTNGAKLISNFGISKIEVIDQSGKLVNSFESNVENEIQINGNFAQGLYFVKVSGFETTKTIKWQVIN